MGDRKGENRDSPPSFRAIGFADAQDKNNGVDMEVSIFLGRALGIYLLIISLSMLFNHRVFFKTFQQWIEQPATITLTAFISIVLGILMVLVHNVWVLDWRLVITLISWLILIKGIVRLNFPSAVPQTMEYFHQHKTGYYALAVFCLIVAIFLLLFSFVSFGA